MKKPCESAIMHLKLKKTSTNDHQVSTDIPKKYQRFSPIRNLCSKRQQKWKSSLTLRLLDTNFESLKNLMMLYIVGKVLASLVEFSNVDDVASCVTQQHMNFVTKRVVAKTAVDRVW